MKQKLIRITTVPESMAILLEGQLKFMKEYYDVVAVSSDSKFFDDMLHQQGDIRGVRINMSRKITPIQDIKALISLIKLFRKEKPFIVHTHTPKAGTLGMFAAWICRVPNRLHTVAGLPLLEVKGAKRILLDFIEKLTYSAATKVYPNSYGLKQIIEENKYTSTSKLKVIGNGSSNGIDTNFFSKESCLKDLNAYQVYTQLKNDSIFTFVFVGRIVKDKGINELVGSFIKLQKEHENVRLILVGNMEKDLDPLKNDTIEAISNCPNIVYVGFKKDVRPYFLVSDVLVFPSYREGFPNVVMQAGAMGLPSIVSNINGCNEIIIEKKNGIIIKPKSTNDIYNAMLWFLNNKFEYMKNNSRQMIVTRYDRQFIWNELLKEYRNYENETA